jgi:hypothetical protein
MLALAPAATASKGPASKESCNFLSIFKLLTIFKGKNKPVCDGVLTAPAEDANRFQ